MHLTYCSLARAAPCRTAPLTYRFWAGYTDCTDIAVMPPSVVVPHLSAAMYVYPLLFIHNKQLPLAAPPPTVLLAVLVSLPDSFLSEPLTPTTL